MAAVGFEVVASGVEEISGVIVASGVAVTSGATVDSVVEVESEVVVLTGVSVGSEGVFTGRIVSSEFASKM